MTQHFHFQDSLELQRVAAAFERELESVLRSETFQVDGPKRRNDAAHQLQIDANKRRTIDVRTIKNHRKRVQRKSLPVTTTTTTTTTSATTTTPVNDSCREFGSCREAEVGVVQELHRPDRADRVQRSG